jgi:hypothetical protein
MCIFYMLCIRKKGTVSYLLYVPDLDFVHQKELNCIIPTIRLYSIFCVSERGKLSHTYSMFMLYSNPYIKARTVLNHFYNLSSRVSEGQHPWWLFLCIKYSYCDSGLNYITGMKNMDIINIFACIRLMVYMLDLDNYITKHEHRRTPYKLITGYKYT